MRFGFWEIILIFVLILVLFGHSKFPSMMKNLAEGINIFKKEIKSDDKPTAAEKPAPAKAAASPAKKAPAKKKNAAKKALKKK